MNLGRSGLIALGVLALLIAALYYRPDPVDRPSSLPAPTMEGRPPGRPLDSADRKTPISVTTVTVEERSDLADALNAKNRDIRSDLQVVATVLDAFRSNFPERGNPTGTNAEITAALTGKNALHLALIPRDHPAINARGELCDRWGHPFFFHQLSGTQMEIRSAGPDKKFWTDDDVVLSP